MKLFLLIFFLVVFIIFLLGGLSLKLVKAEETNPKLHRRLEYFRKHIDPKIKFKINLFWWIAAFTLIYILWS